MKILILPFLLVIAASSFAQSQKEKNFITTVNRVVTALSKKDSIQLSKYIDKATGVYILCRIGVQDAYEEFKAISFNDSTYPNAPFYDNVKMSGLKYAALPTYDCEKWSKQGSFVDTSKTDHLLSSTIKEFDKSQKVNTSVETIIKITLIEANSRRIIITGKEGNELIISLSYINNKWKLIVIDKLTTDCSV